MNTVWRQATHCGVTGFDADTSSKSADTGPFPVHFSKPFIGVRVVKLAASRARGPDGRKTHHQWYCVTCEGARDLRAQTLTMRRRDFVEAARASGESTPRIIFSEILPNEIAIVCASLIFTINFAVLAQVGLEFLGLGNMLEEATANEALLVGAWWFIPPGRYIALLGAGLAFVNFGIDEITNPRLRDTSHG